MFRRIQAFLCVGAIFVVCGCNEEVKEVPAGDSNNTPKVSPEAKQKELDAEMNRNKKALKERAEKNKQNKKKEKS